MLITLSVGLGIGWLLRSPEPTTQESLSENKEAISAVWTCSMHPYGFQLLHDYKFC